MGPLSLTFAVISPTMEHINEAMPVLTAFASVLAIVFTLGKLYRDFKAMRGENAKAIKEMADHTSMALESITRENNAHHLTLSGEIKNTKARAEEAHRAATRAHERIDVHAVQLTRLEDGASANMKAFEAAMKEQGEKWQAVIHQMRDLSRRIDDLMPILLKLGEKA